jgi:hypothetical protein
MKLSKRWPPLSLASPESASRREAAPGALSNKGEGQNILLGRVGGMTTPALVGSERLSDLIDVRSHVACAAQFRDDSLGGLPCS